MADRHTLNVCRHGGGVWRLEAGHKWICGVCHPPAARDVEWRYTPALAPSL